MKKNIIIFEIMLFDPVQEVSVKNKGGTAGKKHYQKLNPEKLERIQKCLDNGQSINSIANREGISEGTVRKAVKTGKLIEKPPIKP
jgi:DNA-binding NarL/FixJ family response regulator